MDLDKLIERPKKTVISASSPDDFRRFVELHVMRIDPKEIDRTHNVDIGLPIVFRSHETIFEHHEPAIRLGFDEAQHLMDALWDCGLRPTQGKGSAGQLDAVKYHLEDMRRLVFEGKKS